jgi:hypothetical protein
MRIPLAGWVAPFGYPGITDRSHLPRAFRSVPRPSSPLSAKASTRCPYFALERHTQRQGSFPTNRDAFRRGRQAKAIAFAENPDIRSQISEIRTTDAANFSFSEDTSCGSHTQPVVFADRGRTRISRYGHTTRFFTIVHQQMPSPPHKGMLAKACSGASCRVRVFAGCRRLSRFAHANHCRRATPVQLLTNPRSGLVEVIGIEPTTPCLQSRCSPS